MGRCLVVFLLLFLITLLCNCTTVNVYQSVGQEQAQGEKPSPEKAILGNAADRARPEIPDRENNFNFNLRGGSLRSTDSALTFAGPFAGFSAEFSKNYFSAQIEGSYAELSTKQSVPVPVASSVPAYPPPDTFSYDYIDYAPSQVTHTVHRKSYEAFLTAGLQVPIKLSPFAVIPKLGIGYGLVSSTDQQNGDYFSPSSQSLQLKTPVAYFGAEIQLFEWLSLNASYMRSFLAQGTLFVHNIASFQFDNPSITRLRSSAQLRLFNKLHVGAEYIRTNQLLPSNEYGMNINRSEEQIGAVLGLEF
ncbi:MAG: hypothetical protein HY537_01520 [Deltaproteobacteria bacterium]|nr:hypothetical protein [Deltaproteobacteria bacterium]